jgi:hypothetical protein
LERKFRCQGALKTAKKPVFEGTKSVSAAEPAGGGAAG